MRRNVAILLVAVAALAGAPGALGERPVREALPNEPFTLDASVCGFAVDFTFPTNREFITTFSNGKQIITGALFATLTNTESQKSITVNISGPGTIVTDANGITTFTLTGSSLFFFLPGQLGPGEPGILILTSGPATLVFNADGDILSFSRTSANVQDLCPVLASP
jgi:hypothetical protein